MKPSESIVQPVRCAPRYQHALDRSWLAQRSTPHLLQGVRSPASLNPADESPTFNTLWLARTKTSSALVETSIPTHCWSFIPDFRFNSLTQADWCLRDAGLRSPWKLFEFYRIECRDPVLSSVLISGVRFGLPHRNQYTGVVFTGRFLRGLCARRRLASVN